jgi:hypothetical protein
MKGRQCAICGGRRGSILSYVLPDKTTIYAHLACYKRKARGESK